MTKTERFSNLQTDLERLATRIETYLQENNFEVAFSKDPSGLPSWFFIQARKTGTFRTAAGARRSTDITIKGTANNFEVSIGTGEWGKNLITSAPLFIIPIVGITATIAKLYTAKRFEDNLWKFIKDQSRFLSGSAPSTTGSSGNFQSQIIQHQDERVYDCEYVEGIPNWDSKSKSGRLVLRRERGGNNQIIFKNSENEQLVIHAKDVNRTKVIARKKGHVDDLMLQIICKGPTGDQIKPIFNINDDIIRGVLAGIDELVGEDKVLKSFENINIITDLRSCVGCSAQIPKESRFCSSCGLRQ